MSQVEPKIFSGKFAHRVLVDNQVQVLRLVSISSFIGLWWLVSLFYPPHLIPGPYLVGERVINIFLEENFLYHFNNTLFRVLTSFVFAMIFSTAIGIVMGSSDTAEGFFETFVLVGLTVPSLAIAMISLILFGIGNTAAIVAVTITIIPAITENMWEGTKNVNRDLIRMGYAFENSRWRIIRHVVIPQLVPYILAASRFGLSIAWKVVVIVEYLGLGNGIGYNIRQAFGLYSFTGVLAWTASFTFVMIVLEFGVIKTLEEYLTRWRVDIEGGDLR